MIHYSKVISGLMAYAENEIVSKMHGSGKAWVIGAAMGIAANKANELAGQLLSNDMLRQFGLVDGEMVDIDTVYGELLKQAQKGSATINVPLLGGVTFSAADVESAYRYIKGA